MAKSVKASEFKAKCLRLMDEVAETGEPVLITKKGKAVAQLAPVRRKPKTAYGALAGSIAVHGDIVTPPGVTPPGVTPPGAEGDASG